MGYQELLTILCLAALLVGAKRLPDLAQTLGESVHRFRCALDHTSARGPLDPSR